MKNHDPDRDIWQLIQTADRDRNPDILAQKYAKLKKNAFAFFRGTCHLFYDDLPVNLTMDSVPNTWICGDLHLENFGAYKGEDRQIYFGINDFDEGALAPCTWDLARLSTSIFLLIDNLQFDRAEAEGLTRSYLKNYADTLSTGRIRSIVQDNSQGIVTALFEDVQRRSRSKLLDERSELIGDRRRLKFDDEKILKIADRQQIKITQAIDNWAKDRANSDFFEVLDIGFRVAGTGSLGLDRYLILVTGKGSPDRNYLLDFKQQPQSALQPYLTANQPAWKNEATRAMTVQQLVQSAPPALLAAIEFNDRSYLLRELQPTQDKIDLKVGKIDLPQLKKLIEIMGQITAFAHLHSSGKSGAAIADEFIAFGNKLDWREDILVYAGNYARQVQLDWRKFCSQNN